LWLAGGAAAAPQAVLYDQTDQGSGTNWIESTNYLSNVQYDSLDSQGADDFQVPGNQIWNISSVLVLGLYTGGQGTSVVDSVLVEFYGNSGSLPASLIYSTSIGSGQITSGLQTGEFLLTLPSALTLPPGRYWLSVQANKVIDGPSGYHWWWRERSQQAFSASAWRNPGGGYGTPCNSYQARIGSCQHPSASTNPDLLFRLDGTTTDIAAQLYFPVIMR
jgi:hypothetical protein